MRIRRDSWLLWWAHQGVPWRQKQTNLCRLFWGSLLSLGLTLLVLGLACIVRQAMVPGSCFAL